MALGPSQPLTDASFEVPSPAGSPVSGVVMADQVKSLAWRARKLVRIGHVSEGGMMQVLDRLRALLPGIG